ncbi:MAG TPA: YCF48-related protein [Pirellulales bacterium]|nr:YCF48-related protein [Pirellulales bacterium]
MPGPRCHVRRRVAVAIALLFTTGRAFCAEPTDSPPPYLRGMQEDAELTDVAFVDAEHGWAVGDRGVIWATTDGGKHWRIQPAQVSCRLASVQFIDPDNGWAAGGGFHPYTHTSRGVLLRTRDGGRSWSHDKGLMLPALKRVKFFDHKLGWAFGDSSALFSSGVFVTDNGGRTWSSVAGRAATGWLAADFLDANAGAIAGRNGMLATIRRRGLQPARTPGFGPRGLNRMKFSGETTGWLAGDGGLILATGDAGVSWQLPTGDPSPLVGSDYDWHALEVRGPRVWIAGSPGTRVLFSDDAGKNWQAFDTGQKLPLYGLAFADNLHGWAVGAFGAILATSDGGRTWQRQRSGGTRAALLALYNRANDVPLELLTRLSGNDGYLAAVEILTHREDSDDGHSAANVPDRAHAALIETGASAAHSAWSFPSPPAGVAHTAEQVVAAWNRVNDGDGIERIEAFLVQQIRCWRPEVVVTHAASLNGEFPEAHVTNQLVLQAVEQAADSTCFPEHLGQMGLEAWRVRKVFGSLPDGQLGDVNVSTVQVAQRLGASLADHVTGPRGLIVEEYTGSRESVGFRLYVDTLPQRVGEHDFFSGIALHPGGDARRLIGEYSTQGIDAMRRMAQKQRNVQAIITRAEQGQLDAARYSAQIDDLTSGLDSTTAGNVIYQLGQHYRQNGNWTLAAETFAMLAERHPDHPLSEAALVWLVQYWSSSETAWLEHRKAQANGRRIATSQVTAQMAVFQPATVEGQVVQAKGEEIVGNAPRVQGRTLAFDGTVETDRAGRSLALAKRLEERSPATFWEPTVRFALAAAQRKQGYTKQAERYYLDVARLRDHDAWWSCAAGEHWLLQPHGLPPKNVLIAANSAKPRLDGRLDDAIWQHADRAKLQGAAADGTECPAQAMLAYDSEFLYLAVECHQPPNAAPAATESPRPRDPDLGEHDRVDFFFDLDRDWTTWFRLTVDHRGWTGEACWDDTTWNPQWFVAAGTGENTWIAEAAIPLAEMSGETPRPKYVWSLGIARTIPGVGRQFWSTSTGQSLRPEAFGYLIFE